MVCADRRFSNLLDRAEHLKIYFTSSSLTSMSSPSFAAASAPSGLTTISPILTAFTFAGNAINFVLKQKTSRPLNDNKCSGLVGRPASLCQRAFCETIRPTSSSSTEVMLARPKLYLYRYGVD